MPQYDKLQRAVLERFGDKVQMFFNDKEFLQNEIGLDDGKWRYSSFEVMDLKTKKVLFTRLGSGVHVTEKKAWVDDLLDEVQECMSAS
mmetsp:Transcript_44223/g.87761  ORF Transcript_44223/g.87761 Transcript_44223/m.87761 type:complete len:88 (-) Transcript_44223:312-575(-)|eukprot:CAMPEP_0172726344 /NCGR_PEP_ID=MMETSP1074-20121228/90494_1 /TAXON_ID=2916 /ORGANISM="Ceratium fusus, Strain PA161109" /LENGTH=87 /DNA_ID=CAMNT_0013553335 /DNA_START=210 /DNA_END=473 /DNA_ORIENTATION=+